MSRFTTQVDIEVNSDLERRLPRMGRSTQRWARTTKVHLAGVGRTMGSVSNSIDTLTGKYVAWGAAIGAGATLKYLTDLQRRFTRLGIQADVGAEALERIKTQMFDVARQKNIAVPVEELMDAVEVIVEKRGDLDLALNNLENIGLAIQASGSNGRDVGAMIADMQEKFGLGNDKEFLESLDTLVVQGKAGAFTLNNMASQGNRLASAMARTGRAGADSIREMGGLVQIYRQGVGSAEQATTAFERTIAGLFAKQEDIKKLGVQLFDPAELAKGNMVMRQVSTVLKEIIIATKGDEAVLGKLFGDEGVRGVSVLARMYRNTGGFGELDKFLSIQGTGSQIQADSARAATDLASATSRLATALQKLADSRLTGVLERLADGLNGLADNDKLFNNVVGGGLGILGLGMANKGARSVGGLMGSLKSTMGGGAAAAGANAGRLSTILGKSGRMLGPLGAIVSAATIGSALLSGDKKQMGGAIGGTVGGLGGWAGGAAAGAAIGSIVPGVGTVIGGGVGGVLGGLAGGFGGDAIGQAIANAVDNKTKEAIKPKKDDLNVHLRVDAPAPVQVVGVNHLGDKNLKFTNSLGRIAPQ